MRERAEGRNDNETDNPRRQARRGAGSRVGRDDAGKELSPTCLLTNLLTCLLAYLPTCELARYTHYAFSAGVSSPFSFLLVPPPRPAITSRPHRILVPSGDTRGVEVFLIRPPHPPGPYPSRSAPFSPAHSFRHLVVPFRPSSRRAYVT